MNLSRNWLNEFVDLHDITDKQFNEEMTLSGSKVETIERLDESLKNVVAGKILSMEKHPDSDHMWVCQIDVGREEPVQIVTGAWNIHIGDLVPAALHKSLLPGGVKIEKGQAARRAVQRYALLAQGAGPDRRARLPLRGHHARGASERLSSHRPGQALHPRRHQAR